MSRQIVSAVFDNRAEAESALTQLRASGVTDRSISLVAHNDHHGGGATGHHDHHGHDHDGDKTRAGLGLGLTAGALLGFGSLLIPGVGPFLAAGALAETLGVTGGAIAAGAAIGGATGGLAGALREHGVSDEDSSYYEDRINRGGVFVSVDTAGTGIDDDVVRNILYNAGGHSASRTRASAI
jgi:hypothetical protein